LGVDFATLTKELKPAFFMDEPAEE